MMKGLRLSDGRAVQPVAQTVELSVVIPVHNEAPGIEGVLRDWLFSLSSLVESFELIVLNDGSTDGTGRILDRLRKEMPQLRVIHQLNVGRTVSLRRGYELGRGVFILTLDANGRYEFADFERLWEKRASFSFILADRRHRLDAFFRRMLAWGLRKTTQALFHYPLHDPNVPFRLVRRDRVLRYLSALPKEWETLDLALALHLHHEAPDELAEVPIPYRRRTFGRGHLGLFGRYLLAIRTLVELCQLRLRLISYPRGLSSSSSTA